MSVDRQKELEFLASLGTYNTHARFRDGRDFIDPTSVVAVETLGKPVVEASLAFPTKGNEILLDSTLHMYEQSSDLRISRYIRLALQVEALKIAEQRVRTSRHTPIENVAYYLAHQGHPGAVEALLDTETTIDGQQRHAIIKAIAYLEMAAAFCRQDPDQLEVRWNPRFDYKVKREVEEPLTTAAVHIARVIAPEFQNKIPEIRERVRSSY